LGGGKTIHLVNKNFFEGIQKCFIRIKCDGIAKNISSVFRPGKSSVKRRIQPEFQIHHKQSEFIEQRFLTPKPSCNNYNINENKPRLQIAFFYKYIFGLNATKLINFID